MASLSKALKRRLLPLALAILPASWVWAQTPPCTFSMPRETRTRRPPTPPYGESPAAYDRQGDFPSGGDSRGIVRRGPPVYLSWNASTSEDVIGYNVYRQPQHGFIQRINFRPLPGTDCIDKTTEYGVTYIYRVRAVSSRGQESVDSNSAKASFGSSTRR
jgi:hypothetical protein